MMESTPNKPEEQPAEFQVDMAQPLKDCLTAYGADNYVDMIGSVVEANGPWFPMYSYSNNFTTETPGGVAWTKMGEIKHEYLPKVVMASDFEAGWVSIWMHIMLANLKISLVRCRQFWIPLSRR